MSAPPNLAHRGFAGKWSCYEDWPRALAIVAGPRLPPIKQRRTNDLKVLNVDNPSTILDYAGERVRALQPNTLNCSCMPISPTPLFFADFAASAAKCHNCNYLRIKWLQQLAYSKTGS